MRNSDSRSESIALEKLRSVVMKIDNFRPVA